MSAPDQRVNSRDVRGLLGMQSPAAWAVVGVYLTGIIVAVAWTLAGITRPWSVAAAVAIMIAASITLLTAPGDPLPWPVTVALTLSGPLACVLVFPFIPVPMTNPMQAWPLTAGTAICTFECVRGRTVSAWSGLAMMIAICVAWSSSTGQGAGYGVAMSLINAGPLLMATFFAYTIRPAAKSIFDLREQSTRRIADEAAATALLDERDRQLRRLDRLARPMLERIATGADLSDDEALECQILEAQLRDRLRAPGLSTPDITRAARSARIRGVEVILLDDHGLDTAAPHIREQLLQVVVEHLDATRAGSTTIRILPPARPVVLTVLVTAGAGTERREYGHDGNPTDARSPTQSGDTAHSLP